MRVAYRETASGVGEGKGEEDRFVGNKRRFATIQLRVHPTIEAGDCVSDGRSLENFVKPFELEGLQDAQIQAIHQGIEEALRTGPLANFPMAAVRVELQEGSCKFDEDSVPDACYACAKRAAGRALMDAAMQPILLEPRMDLQATAPYSYIGSIVADVNSKRRGIITSVGDPDDGGDSDDCSSQRMVHTTTLTADVPLREMVGYSTALRTLSSGEADFSMSFAGYQGILSASIVEEIAAERRDEVGMTTAGKGPSPDADQNVGDGGQEESGADAE